MDQDSQSTPRASSSSLSSSSSSKKPPPPPPTPQLSLVEPANSTKKKNRTRVFRVFRNVFRSFPIITPACKLPSLPGGRLPDSNSRIIPGSRITGTLFGYRKGRVSISIQENPRTLPTVVIELALQTNVLQKEMNLGMVRLVFFIFFPALKDNTPFLLFYVKGFGPNLLCEFDYRFFTLSIRF